MSSSDNFDVIVLGAGVVGVNTAYWNLRNGKSVCVIDRQPAAGLEKRPRHPRGGEAEQAVGGGEGGGRELSDVGHGGRVGVEFGC